MKKKKIDLLEQRLDRELERKKRVETTEETIKKKMKLDKSSKDDQIVKNQVEVKDQDNKDKNQENLEKFNENETNMKSDLEQMKEKLNKLSSKKQSKKKKKIVSEHKISDEDNLDLELDKTISIALPASIILNAQTSELKAYLIGQIARCAAIFNVNEIVVFDEFCTEGNYNDDECEDDKITCVRQMANLLRYLECPQYLRKSLFPLHKDFRSAGVINPLDTKHHLRFEDESEFREGVVNNTRNGKSFVYVGLQKEALINKEIEPGSRVTVQLDIFEDRNYLNGKVVSPYLPTKKLNYYWGYEVRVAKSLTKAIEECPFKNKYDLVIGTSDKGDKLESIEDEIDEYKHALIVFGGLKGLENAINNDPEIENKNPKEFFKYYLNTCPQQGSNVIRTEEALLISLSHLNNLLYN